MCLVWQSVLLGKWLKLVPFFVRGRTVDSEGEEGGGLAVFKINILAVKHLEINILAWVLRKIHVNK